MYEFKYDIVQDEETGRPHITLPREFDHTPEHKFMVLEIALSFLYGIQASDNPVLNEEPEFRKEIEITTNFLHDLSDQIAVLVSEGMKTMDDVNDILNDENDED